MDDKKMTLAGFRDRMYQAYATSHAGRQNARIEGYALKRRVVPMLPPGMDIKIVDIGCGQGTTVQTLQEIGYRNASGVDVSPEQVNLARDAGVRNIECQDFMSYLSERAGSLDAVLATDVLEHCTKHEVLATFDAVHAALRPGGLFIARVPNAASPFAGRIQYGDFTHETAFTVGSLSQICNVTNFKAAKFVDPGPVPHGLFSSIRCVLWAAVSSMLKVLLVIETGQVRGHFVAQTVILKAQK